MTQRLKFGKNIPDATYLKNDDFGKSKKGQEIQSCRDSPFKAIRPHLGLGFRVLATSEGCHHSAHDVCRERDDRLWTPPAAAEGSALSASASTRMSEFASQQNSQ
jgi:hypothetical protein